MIHFYGLLITNILLLMKMGRKQAEGELEKEEGGGEGGGGTGGGPEEGGHQQE